MQIFEDIIFVLGSCFRTLAVILLQIFIIIVIDRFYIVLFSALEQTHFLSASCIRRNLCQKQTNKQIKPTNQPYLQSTTIYAFVSAFIYKFI